MHSCGLGALSIDETYLAILTALKATFALSEPTAQGVAGFVQSNNKDNRNFSLLSAKVYSSFRSPLAAGENVATKRRWPVEFCYRNGA